MLRRGTAGFTLLYRLTAVQHMSTCNLQWNRVNALQEIIQNIINGFTVSTPPITNNEPNSDVKHASQSVDIKKYYLRVVYFIRVG